MPVALHLGSAIANLLSPSRALIAANRALRLGPRYEATSPSSATRLCMSSPASQLRQPHAVQAAYAAIVSSQVQLINILNIEIEHLGEVVAAHFGRHRDAERYLSLPGLGMVLGARILGEFGDDPQRYTDAKARRNYAGTSPITRASGSKRVVLARYARNRRLADAVQQWAFCAMRGSPGARAYYQALRQRGTGHQAALRQLGNRLVGILHGCLKSATRYNEAT